MKIRLAVLAALCSAARAEAPFTLDNTPGQIPKTVVPSAYVIDIVPNLTTLRLTGHETITLNVRSASSTITLDQAGLSISRAVLEDGNSASVAYDNNINTATLHFARPVPAGTHVLTMDYQGPIPNTPAGIYYDDYRTPAGAAARMLVTQFEVADARRMFPGWDEPAFKATFRLSAVLPSRYAALSNMPIESRTPAGAGLTRVQFATTPRMSTYLLALVAGDLTPVRDKTDGTPIAVWAPTGEQDQGRYALSVEKNVLPYYNAYFGVKYPLPKLDLIAIPGNYDAGAMENWGAITFIDNGLLLDPATTGANVQFRIHTWVAHEMSHQWSGDLVTMGWWDDIWLNEGFATWMENKATDHFNPSWEVWPRAHADREEAMGIDARSTTHAIHQPIADVSQAESAFDDISYQKGEQVIRMVEDWLGPDVFRDGMRRYMKAHAYSNTTDADLWAALSAASGKNVAQVAAGFTDQPGIPLVIVRRDCGGSPHLTLSQQRFTIGDPNAKKLTWQIPVSLGVPNGPLTRVLLGTTPVTVPLPGCDAAEKANIGEEGYYRVQYDDPSRRALLAQISDFGPADRAELYGDQYALFAAGRAPLADWLDMLPKLRGETDIAIWSEALGRMRRLDHLIAGTPVQARFRLYAQSVLLPEFTRLGWNGKPGETILQTLLRPRIVAALGQFGDPAVIAEAHRRFAAFMQNPASLPPDMRAPVLDIVGLTADPATYAELRRLGEQATGTEEKLRDFTAMAMAQDPALIAQTARYAGGGQIPNGRITEVLYNASDEGNAGALWHAIQQNQAPIRKHLTDDDQAGLLPAAADGSADPAIARALLGDPASNASSGARIAAAQAAQKIEIAADLRRRAVAPLGAWLSAHGG